MPCCNATSLTFIAGVVVATSLAAVAKSVECTEGVVFPLTVVNVDDYQHNYMKKTNKLHTQQRYRVNWSPGQLVTG